MKFVVSKPELTAQISKPIFVGLPIEEKINRAIQTSLKNGPTATDRGHITQYVYRFAAIWNDGVHTAGIDPKLKKLRAAFNRLWNLA